MSQLTPQQKIRFRIEVMQVLEKVQQSQPGGNVRHQDELRSDPGQAGNQQNRQYHQLQTWKPAYQGGSDELSSSLLNSVQRAESSSTRSFYENYSPDNTM